MHAAALMRDLGARETVVPRHPGLFSAWGMLATAPRHDQVRTEPMAADEASGGDLGAVFEAMTANAAAYFGSSELDHAAQIELRYHGQEHTVAVPVELDALELDALTRDFHRAHERAYTFSLEDTRVEIIHFRLASTERRRLPEIAPPPRAAGALADAVLGRRPVHFGGGESGTTPVYDRDRLPFETEIAGPAVIAEPTSTTRVLPGQRFWRDRLGLIRIREN
jgi:N-methylhydantoinase A